MVIGLIKLKLKYACRNNVKQLSAYERIKCNETSPPSTFVPVITTIQTQKTL